MPTFSEEIDFVITTYDFLDDCDNHEIENIIDYLEELGYLKNFKRAPGGNGGNIRRGISGKNPKDF